MIRLLVITLLCALSLPSCKEEQTYVVVTVEAEDGILTGITELTFTSSVTRNGVSLNTDTQTVSKGGQVISLPETFVVLANGWGDDDEHITLVVNANPSSPSGPLARARGTVRVIAGSKTGATVTLRVPCEGDETVCLDGASFCDNPHNCVCDNPEGECTNGVCEPIPSDDGNPCTLYDCDPTTNLVSHNAFKQGETCGSEEGFYCGQGVCKEPDCGDFIIDGHPDIASDFYEECDNGEGTNNDDDPDQCRTSCKLPFCGDGVVDFGEECDEGANNVVVMDGMSNEATFGETCRQSVTLRNPDGSTTSLTCALPRCGDGVLDGTERCDDHNSDNGDGCNPTCSLFGQVSLVAGQRGGPGDADGIGQEARTRPVLGITSTDTHVYVTTEPNREVVRRLALADAALETISGRPGAVGDIDGIGDTARFDTPSGLAVTGNTLYVADHQNHRIKQIDLNSMQVETLVGTGQAGTDDGAASVATLTFPFALALRNSNELLFVEQETSCRLRWVNLTTMEVRTLLTPALCASTGGIISKDVESMTVADNGRLYFSDRQQIREVTFTNGTNPAVDPPTAVITTLAGSQTMESGHVDATGTAARFNLPKGLAAVGGILFVADQGNNAIREINLSTGGVRTATPVGASVPLEAPRAVAIVNNRLLVSGNNSSVVLEGPLVVGSPPGGSDSTYELSEFAGLVEDAGLVDDTDMDQNDTSRFDYPHGFALLSSESNSSTLLYVADQLSGALRQIDLDSTGPSVLTLTNSFANTTAPLRALASWNDLLLGIFGEEDPDVVPMNSAGAITGTPRTVNARRPDGIAVVGDFAYITGSSEPVVYRLHLPSGDFERFSGETTDAAVIDGSRFTARFVAPSRIVVCQGNLYFTEKQLAGLQGNVIRKIDLSVDPAYVSTVAGFATTVEHHDATGLSARFAAPSGIACDERDPDNVSLYVSEVGNHTIRQIELNTGRVTTLAGTPYYAGAVDGVGLSAGFNFPEALIFDPDSGDLFVADSDENIVRRIQ